MDKAKTEKITRFVMDEALVDAVYGVLLDSFLKKRERANVQMAAAERVAIDLLGDAWKELDKYKKNNEQEPVITKQVGL